MRKVLFGAALGSFALLLAPDRANAKAHDNPEGNVTVEGVITAVDATDNPGDADLNFYIRPLAPGEQSAFPNTIDTPENFLDAFWVPGADELEDWIERNVAEKLKETRKKGWSAQCKACAKGEENSCRPSASDRYDNSNPCPKVFSCPACAYDVWRHNKSGDHDLEPLADFGVKSELFVARHEGDDDFNSNLDAVMEGLGIKRSNNISFEEGAESGEIYCREFEWKGGEWKKNNKQICGKHALFTGVRTFDDAHYYRMEIHPLSSIVLAMKPEHYKVGAFIDGSSSSTSGDVFGSFAGCFNSSGDGCNSWEFNYREEFGKAYMPDSVKFMLGKLQGPQPKATNGAFWIPKCSIHQTSSLNASDSQSSSAVGLCPATTVKLDFSRPGGAAWTGDVLAGWQKRKASLKITKVTNKTPGGVLAYNPSDAIDASGGSVPTTTTGTKPDPTKNTCDFRKRAAKKSKRSKQDKLRRWYQFEIETNATAEKVDPKKMVWDWKFDKPISHAMSVNPSAKQSPLGPEKFTVWMPVRAFGKYSADILGNLIYLEGIAGRENNLDVRVVITKVKQLDDEDGWGDNDFYGKVSIDGNWQPPSSWKDGESTVTPNWGFHSGVGQTRVPVALQIWDDDGGLNFEDDQVDITPGKGRTLNFLYDTATGKISGDVSGTRGKRISAKGKSSDRSSVEFTVTDNRAQGGHEAIAPKPTTVARATKTLTAPRPSVTIKAGAAKVNSGQTLSYTADIKADPHRFCGDDDALRYTWRKNGQKLNVQGAGPIQVTLAPGQTETYEVTVHDPWGVEFATEAIVVGAPPLDAAVAVTCQAGRTSSVAGGLKGVAGGKKLDPMARDLCSSLKLVGGADDSGGAGATWASSKPGPFKYEWSDLKYLEDTTDAKWQPVPDAWLAKDDATGSLTLSVAPLRFVNIVGTLTITEIKTGRADVANFRTSTDKTPKAGIEAIITALWKAARPGKKLPNTTDRSTKSKDRIERQADALLTRLERIKANDQDGLDRIRRNVNAFRRYVVAMMANNSFGPHGRPVWTKKRQKMNFENMLRVAKHGALQRVRSDGTMTKLLRAPVRK